MQKKYIELGMGKKPLRGWVAIASYLRVDTETTMVWAEEGLLPIQETPFGEVWAYEEDLDSFIEVEKPLAEGIGKNRPPQTISISFSPEISEQEAEQTLTALANYYRACGGLGFELVGQSDELSDLGASDA